MLRAMRFFRNDSGVPDAYYEPNSFGGPVQDQNIVEPTLRISGDADRYNHRAGNDEFSQPRALFRLFSPQEKQRLFSNYADAMQGVPEYIIERQLALFAQIDPEYANGVRSALDVLKPEPVAGD